MIFFIVAVGTRAEVQRIAPTLPQALERSRIVDGPISCHTSPHGMWALAAIEEPDPCCQSRLAAEEDAFAVFNGPAIAANGDQRNLAQRCLKSYSQGGTTAAAGALTGTYNFVGASPRHGVRAFTDFSGMYPLYWHASNGLALLSNRSLAIADALGARNWNLHALAWIIARANLVGTELPLQGVHVVPAGLEAQAEPGTGALALTRNSSWIWPAPSEDRGRDNLSSSEWDDVTHVLVESMKALHGFDTPLRLSLTGGKDSRLCLALAKAADLAEWIDVYTNGGPDSPEVEVASAVAAAAGVPHRRQGPAAGAPAASAAASPFSDSAKVWQRLCRNITRYEAIVPPWAALVNPTFPPFVNIKGFGGEFYRHGSDARFKMADVGSADELARRFAAGHLAMDRLGVIRAAEAEYQAEWLAKWVNDAAGEVRLDVVHERFEVESSHVHWTGPLLQCTPLRVNINPLASPRAAIKNLELSPDARRSERFHFEVMRRAAPELVSVPFLNDVWSPTLADGSSFDLPAEPFSTTVKPVGQAIHQGNPGWEFVEAERRAIDLLFKEAAKHTEFDAICDVKKLRRRARSRVPLTRFGEIRELVGSISIALTLLGRAEPTEPVIGA